MLSDKRAAKSAPRRPGAPLLPTEVTCGTVLDSCDLTDAEDAKSNWPGITDQEAKYTE